MEEEKWWAGEDRAPTLRPLLVRGQGNEICRKPKGIRKFRETLSHGCTANMICASLRSGGRRLAVRIVMEHPIGALPRTPFASSRRSPQGETRDMREKTASHILHVPFRWFPPLVAGATTFTQREACHWIFGSLCSPTNPVPLPPRKRGHYGCLAMEPCLYRKAWSGLFCPLHRGKSGTAG